MSNELSKHADSTKALDRNKEALEEEVCHVVVSFRRKSIVPSWNEVSTDLENTNIIIF